jgi:hypothetical protein
MGKSAHLLLSQAFNFYRPRCNGVTRYFLTSKIGFKKMALKDSFSVSKHGEITAKLALNDENDAPEIASNGKQVIIELHNEHSKSFKSAKFKATQSYRLLIQKGKQDSLAAEEARDVNMLAAAFVGWENMEDEDGQPLEFTPENVQIILKEYPHIRQQVNQFVANLNEFVKKTTLVA